MSIKYALITPVKNEELFFPKCAQSVTDQTIKPQKWIIINDNSTDKTGDIISNLAKQHNWIETINNKELINTKRRIGGQAVIHLGLQRINFGDYDFIIRMDGDVLFEPDFFQKIFQKFEQNPDLGIASGVCYVEEDNKLMEEKNPNFHTRGPLKIYKSKCLHDIGGLIQEEGWDTIDEIKANMLGWETRNFDELRVIHLRRTQSASGALRGFLNQGYVAYFIGYHPLFMLLRAIRKMFIRPFIIGGIYLYAGYLHGFIKRAPRFEDKKITNYMREQQINKILGKESIWK